MTDSLRTEEMARAEIAGLLPIRERLSQRSSALRLRLGSAEASRRDKLAEKAHRCDQVVRLLDARIRLAAELIALGTLARDGSDLASAASESAPG